MKVYSLILKILIAINILILLGSCDCRTRLEHYVFRNHSSFNIDVEYADVECVIMPGTENEYTEERTYTTFTLHIGETNRVSAQILVTLEREEIEYWWDAQNGFVESSITTNDETGNKEVIFVDP
jgi:hypothetical protein